MVIVIVHGAMVTYVYTDINNSTEREILYELLKEARIEATVIVSYSTIGLLTIMFYAYCSLGTQVLTLALDHKLESYCTVV